MDTPVYGCVLIREYLTLSGQTFQWIDRVHEPMEVFPSVCRFFREWKEEARLVDLD
jgi:hypothetical protein